MTFRASELVCNNWKGGEQVTKRNVSYIEGPNCTHIHVCTLAHGTVQYFVTHKQNENGGAAIGYESRQALPGPGCENPKTQSHPERSELHWHPLPSQSAALGKVSRGEW